MIVAYQLFLRGQTPSWDYSIADRSRRKLIDRPLAFHGPSLHLQATRRVTRWKILRFSRRIDLAEFNVNVDRLRNRASLDGWVMPINFIHGINHRRIDKKHGSSLSREPIIHFLSVHPVLTPLTLFLYLLSLGHPAFVPLLPR